MTNQARATRKPGNLEQLTVVCDSQNMGPLALLSQAFELAKTMKIPGKREFSAYSQACSCLNVAESKQGVLTRSSPDWRIGEFPVSTRSNEGRPRD
jgi:hypothetical protein